MPRFHAQDDVLFDYASGSLPAPVSLLVAAHLSFCGQCRDDVASIETIGGAYLEAIDPVPMEAGALESAFDRLAGAEVETSTGTGQNAGPKFADGLDRLPSPLSRFLAARDRATVWTRRARGIEEIDVIADDDRFSASLMRIQPGVSIPNHTHTGEELTLVLQGGFSDGHGHYGPGDVCHADPDLSHMPVADPDAPCLCLVVADGPVKLTGLVGRMLNPFLKL
jgi:putative transcriptional regulator